jgi:polar amino acid transport system substrate-binding protein
MDEHMKKNTLRVLLAVMMLGLLLALASCGGDTTPAPTPEPSPTDSGTADGGETPEAGDNGPTTFDLGGTLTLGVTQFNPMNFLDDNGDWTGFDTEFALIVGERLGMDVEFQEITWAQKFLELQAGTIDAIWNGMTANTIDGTTGRPRYEDVDFTLGYMLNRQAAVIRADRFDEFTSADDLAGLTGAAETGSAGHTIVSEYIGDGTMVDKTKQVDTFVEVMAGTVDFAVVDSILAHRLAGTEDFADLMVLDLVLGPREEMYAIGFPIGSGLVEQVNAIMLDLFADGTLYEIASRYGLENSISVRPVPAD